MANNINSLMGVAFFWNHVEYAAEVELRLGMSAKDFLERLYELRYSEPLNLDEEELQYLRSRVDEMSKETGKECGYELDSIRARIFSMLMTQAHDKTPLRHRLQQDPDIQALWQQCPMLQVIMEYMIKIVER